MFNPSYLTISRHNLYYLRYPIPPSFHPDGKRSDIKVSLGTRNPAEALHLGRCLAHYADRVFKSPAALTMQHQEMRNLLSQHFTMLLDKQRALMARTGPLEQSRTDALEGNILINNHALAENDFETFFTDKSTTKFIDHYKLAIEPDSPAYALFRQELLKAQRDYSLAVLEHHGSLSS